MIKEFVEIGEIICKEKYGENAFARVALKEEMISMDLVIKGDGSFISLDCFEKRPTIAECISAKKGKARLLVDKAEEVLCFGGSASQKKHQLFLKKLSMYESLQELAPVFNFYKQNKTQGADAALNAFVMWRATPEGKKFNGNLAFRVGSERLHENSRICNAVVKNYEDVSREKLNRDSSVCSVCARSVFPVEKDSHGMIKNVKNIGGQSSGSALVSYNNASFESYRLEGNYNSSVCAYCAKHYVEGLNWLLSAGRNVSFVVGKSKKEKNHFNYSHRKKIGADTALVFWTQKNAELMEMDQLERPDEGEVVRLFSSIASGNSSDSRYFNQDQFYACALSGAAGRLAVRDWFETSLFDFHKSIVCWFKDTAIGEYDKSCRKISTRYIGLYDLAKCCQRQLSGSKSYDDDDVTPARLSVYLWKAALKNISPPMWILSRVLQRARISGVNAQRASLIKLLLNRNKKEAGLVVTENGIEGAVPVSYLCGQLFAEMERMQYASSGERSAGIRERYFTYAMTSPAAAFGRLFDLYGKHYKKLKNDKPGMAVVIDKEVQVLCKDVDVQNFPATFSLEERGYFAIGYYHQRQKDFLGKKNNVTITGEN